MWAPDYDEDAYASLADGSEERRDLDEIESMGGSVVMTERQIANAPPHMLPRALHAKLVARELGILCINEDSLSHLQQQLLSCTGTILRRSHLIYRSTKQYRKRMEVGAGGNSDAEHHDALLPTWQALADAVRDSPNNDVSRDQCTVSFYNMKMPVAVWNVLGPAFEGRRIKGLTLENVSLGNEGLIRVARFIEHVSALTELTLREHLSKNLHAAMRLFFALENRSDLRSVALSGCSLGDNMSLLSIALHRTRKVGSLDISENNIGPDGARIVMEHMLGTETNSRLDLSRNNFGDIGAAFIASALSCNPDVQYLLLNNWTDEGIIKVARALKANTELRRLHAEPVGDAATEAVRNAVFDTSTLEAIEQSNHTCSVHIGREDKLLGFSNRLLSCDIDLCPVQMKVRHALGVCNDGSLNVRYLMDLPLDLMPHALHFVQIKMRRLHRRRSDGKLCDMAMRIKRELGLGINCCYGPRWPRVLLQHVYDVVRNCLVHRMPHERNVKVRGSKAKQKIGKRGKFWSLLRKVGTR